MMYKISAILLSLLFTVQFSSAQDSDKALSVIHQMMKAIEGGKGYTYELVGRERIKSQMTYNRYTTKIKVKPLEVYVLSHEKPNAGVELLYNEGQRDNKALVNAGKWIPNVKLSPFNSKLRKDQHHTILNSGFGFLHKIVSSALKRSDEASDNLVYDGGVTFDGRACHKIIINDPTFSYAPHTIKEGETLYSISRKNLICEYLIIENNSKISGFSDGNAGEQIKIPSSYAKKTILYIDKENLHPIYQEMHDDKGEFERYEFKKLEINPIFADDEFTKDFSGYDY